MKRLSSSLFSVTSPLMTPEKSLWSGICLGWPAIVGPLAKVCRPLNMQHVRGGRRQSVLWIGVWGGHTFVLSHETHTIIDAVNRYAGKDLVAQVKYKEIAEPIKQKASGPQDVAPLCPRAQKQVDTVLTKNNDEPACVSVETALRAFGRALYRKTKTI
ncbi:DciA family protein [Candidatus Hepatobacter penaei]|uniref:DciA family protein n=1 Tax=Candidatus Hepatobacter penaei TaxID=1274402 RepID=UPI0012E06253|nr:DciA family protein [Candidatus Hepatobacter penaei]